MIQCWQHKHGRIPPFISFYVIHFSYGQITEQFQMFKLDLEKAVKPEIKLPTSIGSSKKEENSRKTCTFTLLTMPKPLPVWITTDQQTVFSLFFHGMGCNSVYLLPPHHLSCLLSSLSGKSQSSRLQFSELERRDFGGSPALLKSFHR